MSAFTSVPMVILVVLVACFPLYIGGYVYCDAKRRDMNPWLWALIAALVPSLIGFLVYLLVRGPAVDLQCPQCQNSVKAGFVVCPHCGTKLRPACPNCGIAVEPDWKVCPQCAQPLPAAQPDVRPPVRVKDKSLRTLLIVVAALLFVFVCITVLGLTVFTSVGASSYSEISFDEYFAQQQLVSPSTANQVQQWLDEVRPELNHAYALRYDTPDMESNRYFYLIYVPAAGEQSNVSMDNSSSIFGNTFTLNLEHTGKSDSLFCVSTFGDKAPKLKIKLDGKRIRCDVSTVDFNPTPIYTEHRPSSSDTNTSVVHLPEYLWVTKYAQNGDSFTFEVEEPDTLSDIVSLMSAAPLVENTDPIYHLIPSAKDYDFIVSLEYMNTIAPTANGTILDYFVFEQNDSYYLADSSTLETNPAVYTVDQDFYDLLKNLFV